MAAPTPTTPTAPPVYQPPTIDKNAEITAARSTLDPQYQQAIGLQQANIPLYQQELANTKQALQQQQDQQTNQLNRTAQNLTGRASVGNASRGIFDSSVQQNAEQNIATDKNNQIQALVDSILNRTNTAQNNFNKQKLGVDQVITSLQNEENQKVNDLANANVNQKMNEYNTTYDRMYKAYQGQVAQQQFQDQMNQRAQLAALSRGSGNTLQNLLARNEVLNHATLDANGNAITDQNTLYRNIIANQKAYEALGGNPEDLWSIWRNTAYGGRVPGNVLGQGQSAIDAYLRTAAASKPAPVSNYSSGPSIYDQALQSIMPNSTNYRIKT